jgi:predicted amidohydrolase YtcJ
MLTAGLSGFQLDLTTKKYNSIDQLMQIIKEYSNKNIHQKWIRCIGVDESKLEEGRLPDRFEIDRYIDDKSVIITRVCSHVSILNSRGLMTLELKDEEIGRFNEQIGKNNDSLNGIIKDEAQLFVLEKLPEYTEAEIIKAIAISQKELFKMGICCVHEPGTDQVSSISYIDAYKKSEDLGILKMRTYLMGRKVENDVSEVVEKISSLMSDYTVEKTRLFFGAMKFFADGSIGGKSAAINDEYINENSKGILLTEDLFEQIEYCSRRGFQISVHAIGDRAIEHVIDLIESIGYKGDKFHRIEHCELCNNSIIERINKNNIMVSFQPSFIHEFGDKYIENLGNKRIDWIKPIKSFLEKNIVFSFSADYPFADGNPLHGVKHAVERKTRNGVILNAKERISVYEALKAYTANGSRLSCTEKYHGTLSEGKFADFTILDKDILNDGLDRARVVYTIIDDEVVYDAGKNK